MKKASEYRQHAQACRDLAAQIDSEAQRTLMLQMAGHWERLADDRAALIRNHPELAQEEDQADEARARPGPGPGGHG